MFNSKNIIRSVLFLFCVGLFLPGTAAYGGERAQTWDFTIPLNYTGNTNIDGKNGSVVNLNQDLGIGFSFGYNFTDKFQLGGIFNFRSRSYDATVALQDGSTKRYSSTMEDSTIAVKGTYHFLEGDFTPFISGSIGYTEIDTNIPTGPPSGSCWWDPWWGWVCNSYVPTKTENALSYGGGLGLRYDINEIFGMKFSYNITWIDIDKVGTPDIDSWALGFIIKL